jgi:hypothetical protein
MPKKDITITLSAPAGSGRMVVTQGIFNMLKQIGFTVTLHKSITKELSEEDFLSISKLTLKKQLADISKLHNKILLKGKQEER